MANMFVCFLLKGLRVILADDSESVLLGAAILGAAASNIMSDIRVCLCYFRNVWFSIYWG